LTAPVLKKSRSTQSVHDLASLMKNVSLSLKRGAGSEKIELQLDRQTALFPRAWRTAATLAT